MHSGAESSLAESSAGAGKGGVMGVWVGEVTAYGLEARRAAASRSQVVLRLPHPADDRKPYAVRPPVELL